VALPAAAADPCAGPGNRALVLSSGGSKGAFQAGAIYHLVVNRGCDFVEIAGNSVGALNGALLAQAARSDDPATSLANLRASAENLVERWFAITSGRVVMRQRPVGKLRFALFGLDSIEDFAALHTFIRTYVALDRLAAGRELRVGTLSFNDGRYREILINRGGHVDAATAHDFIFGSAIVPVFGRMPVMTPPNGGAPLQFGDGGVRHQTPVASYFTACTSRSAEGTVDDCAPLTGANTPPHPEIEQLFVVVTSPFARRDDARPVFNPKAVDPRTGQIEDGRQILVRTFDLLVDTTYRDDLDDMLTYNELLAWHARNANRTAREFPIGSFNRADGVSLPYDIALIAPQREESDPMSIFDVSVQTQRRELFCGCIAADALMQTQYGLESRADSCVARFPNVPAKRRQTIAVPLDAAVCATPAPSP
jgi:predicted acylesterase/phospholipase RssA